MLNLGLTWLTALSLVASAQVKLLALPKPVLPGSPSRTTYQLSNAYPSGTLVTTNGIILKPVTQVSPVILQPRPAPFLLNQAQPLYCRPPYQCQNVQPWLGNPMETPVPAYTVPYQNMPFGGGAVSREFNDGYRPRPGGNYCETCPKDLPAQVKSALRETMEFRKGCRMANRGPQQKIVINDYSANGDPYMYVFDAEGNCLDTSKVTYGSGAGQSSIPRACNRDGSHLTPAGFHLTFRHANGTAYRTDHPNPWQDALGLVGLEGQQSTDHRGILIHPAEQPGTASSWGCSGIGFQCFFKIKKSVGFGGLVYNYFGNTPAACGGTTGLPNRHRPESCRLDDGSEYTTREMPPVTDSDVTR